MAKMAVHITTIDIVLIFGTKGLDQIKIPVIAINPTASTHLFQGIFNIRPFFIAFMGI